MKKSVLSIATAIALFGTSLSAMAADTSVDRSGFYLGAKTGWAEYNNCDANSDCDDDAWAGSAFAGYQFNNWLSYELGYNYLGNTHGQAHYNGSAQDTTETQNVEMSLKADWYLTNDFNLFAKAGGAFNRVESETAGVERSDYDTSLMLGAGMEYSITDNFRFRTEYQWFDNAGTSSVGEIDDIQYVSMGFLYKFSQSNQNAELQASIDQLEAQQAQSQADLEAAQARADAAEQALANAQPQTVYNSNSFETNSTEMSEAAKQQTVDTLESLKADPELNARIVGHTDATGSASYNEKLSKKRADAVAAYLEEQGIDASRITTQGMGESTPVATNETEEGRAQNRRVEVFLVK